ncbi:(2Fe-2S)-binding protein [Elongatibacter sediminis]|uniref:(2Fe-2S)-binding protein n=1 Tax=Elongatibacter sediminis TaxID=3119006 RepID=A0AAW9RAG0_9GAMM
MKELLTIEVNGERHEVAIEKSDSLARVLRDRLGMTATKRGCDTGGCGCCTVLVDGRAVYSCMTFAKAVGERKVTTVEGLVREGELDPLQQAFIDADAVQCGYCTCGMMMAARQLLDENPDPSEDEIRKGISGNLCRCTGYSKIVDAIQLAAAAGRPA